MSRAYRYTVEIDHSSLDQSAATIKRVLGQAMAEVQAPDPGALRQRMNIEQIAKLENEQQKQITLERRRQYTEAQRLLSAQREQEVQAKKQLETERRTTAEFREQARAEQDAARRRVLTDRSRMPVRGLAVPPPVGGAGLAGMGAGLAVAGLGFVGAIGGREVVQAAGRMAAFSTEIERTSEAFVILSGGAANAERKLRAIQLASGGAIDKMTAMGIANRAAALGMANTAEELSRVTRFATIAGRVLGMDTAGALDNLALASSNLSFVRLDQMGVSASEVRKRFNELKKTMGENEAFLQATLEVGERTFSGLKDSSLSAASGAEQLNTRLKEIWQTLALPVGNAADSLAGFLAAGLGYVSPGASQQAIDDEINRLQSGPSEMVLGGTTDDRLALLTRINKAATKAKDLTVQGVDQAGRYEEALLNAGRNLASMPGIPSEEIIGEIEQVIDAIGRLQYAAGAQSARLAPRINLPAGYSMDSFNALMDMGAMGTSGLTTGQLRDRELNRSLNERLRQAEADTIRDRIVGIHKDANKQIIPKVADEWKAAAQEAADAFEDALKKVPGLFGTSEVTQTQLDRAEAGVPQEFADNYLRRLTDEVLNGVERADVDIQDAARRAGIDGSLPQEMILDMFREAWDSGSLFANPENLDLIDMDAVRAGLAQQAAAATGQENLLAYLSGQGLDMGSLGDGPASAMAGGIAGAFPEAIAGQDMAGPAITAISDQFTADTAIQQWRSLGNSGAAEFFKGYEDGLTSQPWVGALKDAIQASIWEDLLSAIQNP